jgi:hypothetical protein
MAQTAKSSERSGRDAGSFTSVPFKERPCNRERASPAALACGCLHPGGGEMAARETGGPSPIRPVDDRPEMPVTFCAGDTGDKLRPTGLPLLQRPASLLRANLGVGLWCGSYTSLRSPFRYSSILSYLSVRRPRELKSIGL